MVEKKSIGEVQSEINADYISDKFDELHDRITRLSKILDQHNDRFKQSENKISEILTDMIIFNKWRTDIADIADDEDSLFCVGDVCGVRARTGLNVGDLVTRDGSDRWIVTLSWVDGSKQIERVDGQWLSRDTRSFVYRGIGLVLVSRAGV